jgi:hypothetical protein
MMLDHEGLDVYQLALDFLVFANGIIERLPRGRSHLADQFTRASLSIVLNIAEGAGKLSKLDKRRYYMRRERVGDRIGRVVGRLLPTQAARREAIELGQGLGRPYRLDACQTGSELRGQLSLDSQPE